MYHSSIILKIFIKNVHFSKIDDFLMFYVLNCCDEKSQENKSEKK